MQKLVAVVSVSFFLMACTSTPSLVGEEEDGYVFPPAETVEPVDSDTFTVPEAPDSVEKRATQTVWQAFLTGETSGLEALLDDDGQLVVHLEHSILSGDPARDHQTFEYTGMDEIEGWITALHTPQGEFGMIWGDAFQVEGEGERYIAVCENLSCDLEGGILHNTLFLDKVSFSQNDSGDLVVKEVTILHGD